MTDTTTETITASVRYFAAARAAAGRDSEEFTLPAGADLAALITAVRAAHGPELSRVLDRCSYLVDEVAPRDHSVTLRHGAVVDVLPPFAGG